MTAGRDGGGPRSLPAGTGQRAFATSASLLIVFLGLFLALGSLYTVSANTAERLADAQADQRERGEAVQLTRANLTSAVWDANDATLTLRVTNTGDTTLSVQATDTVVDGTYVSAADYDRVEVEGADTDLWRPGQELVLEDTDPLSVLDSSPERVRLVTETGVADAREVSEV